MKSKVSFLMILLAVTTAFSQKKTEKLKGSKVVTTKDFVVADFSSVSVNDALEVSFIKADSASVQLEADDNLHHVLKVGNTSGRLTLNLSDKLRSYKKFEVVVYYTETLKKVEANDQAKLMILDEMDVEEQHFKINDKAKLYLNLKAKKATVEINHDAEAELNTKTESIHFILTKSGSIKALVASTEMKIDQYQKSKTIFEGDVIDLKIRTDNNAKFEGRKLTAKNVEILAEGYSETSVFAETSIKINAFANSQITLFGEPTIELEKFTGKTTLKKNILK